jgi:hypothetical protein
MCRWWNAVVPVCVTAIVMLVSLFVTGMNFIDRNPGMAARKTVATLFENGDAFG